MSGPVGDVPSAHSDRVTPLGHISALLTEMDVRYRMVLAEMDIRYQQRWSEMDLRYQQRYDAQTKAVETAMIAQQTAMQAALLAAEKAVQTAMTASEKAVTKAETAAEKRFDSVNEFRKAYQDLISLMLPRVEAEQRLTQMSEQIAELKQDAYQTRGRSAGLNAGWVYLIGAVALVGSLIAIVVRL